jgi:hypothetical protein
MQSSDVQHRKRSFPERKNCLLLLDIAPLTGGKLNPHGYTTDP